MKIKPISLDDGSLENYSLLLRPCFPPTTENELKFSKPSLKWLYCENPDGQAIGFDAFDGDMLIAHYVCIPAMIVTQGVLLRGLLSVNTVTHPKAQGLGIFTKLATLTFESAVEQGYQCVYGVANQNSTHGFVNRLGFSMVSSLQAFVGLGRHSRNLTLSAEDSHFSRSWTPKSITWRCNSPARPIYTYSLDDGCTQYFSKTQVSGINAYAELPQSGLSQNASWIERGKLRLFLGLGTQTGLNTLRLNIPNQLRPSPLNFIFKSLTGSSVSLDPNKVVLNFLDFDAY